MNIENVNASNFIFRSNSAEKASANAPKFSVRTYSDNTPIVNTWDGKTMPDAVTEMEKMTGRTAPGVSWSVTEEEAAELREKYGDTYDEDTVYKLYDELSKKNIIDGTFFTYASGYDWIMPLDGRKDITFCRLGAHPGDPDYYIHDFGNSNCIANWVSDVIIYKDKSREEEYSSEWQSFKSGYDKEIITWKDALQENIDFARYIKEVAKESTSGKYYPSASSSDREINGLEKVKSVISQIFG